MIALVLGIALVMSNSAPSAPSLTLNQSNPAFGQAVTFTGVYGKVYGGRQPQLPNQPQVQVNCTLDADGSGWQANQETTNKQSLGGGWNQSTYPFTLGGQNWTSGGASCSAVLFYFDGNLVLHELAFANFTVSP